LLQDLFHTQPSIALEEKKGQFESTTKIFSKKFRFLALAWISPPTLFGQPTFLSDLISQYGGQNLLNSKLPTPYPQVSMEWLVKNPPDILFLLTNQKESLDELQRLARKWWPNQKVKLVTLSPDHFARPTFTPLDHICAVLREAL
jgi:ABC-type Fe3+-citrate transport system substrate-binding protein